MNSIMSYSDAVKTIKQAILHSQYQVAQLANRELLSLYYGIGKFVSEKTRENAWGTFYEQWKVLENRPPAVGDLEAEQLQSLAAYLRILDDEVRKPFENPSIGIVLCKDANKAFVEYLIQGYDKPMGVATYKTADEIKRLLPSEEQLKGLLTETDRE